MRRACFAFVGLVIVALVGLSDLLEGRLRKVGRVGGMLDTLFQYGIGILFGDVVVGKYDLKLPTMSIRQPLGIPGWLT